MPRVIDTEQALKAWLPDLQASPWVAIDTEADSLHAYPEKLCLIQVSVPGADRLVDPLAGVDLACFYEALGGHELILHGGDYDLRLLHRHAGFVPGSIFDTMMAARLLGCTQFGLASLVEQFLGVKLEKGPQTADWARRPLTERMEAYARNDTRHLHPLATRLREDLSAKGRLEWHREYCQRLIRESVQPVEVDTDRVWRVKGSHKLDRHGLAVVRELWHWREREAVAANRPPFFILNHERLSEIAAAAVTGRPWHSLIPPRYSERRRQTLLQAVEKGIALPKSDWPDRIRGTGQRPNEAEKRRFAALQNHRDARARELGIDPTLIASRSTLFSLAREGENAAAGLMAWQRTLLS
jgi:ribonuclease D